MEMGETGDPDGSTCRQVIAKIVGQKDPDARHYIMAIPLAALSTSPVSFRPQRNVFLLASSPLLILLIRQGKTSRATRDAAIDHTVDKRWLYRLRCCEPC
ncbi:hypothetical protein VPH35_034876 [Triticum aestivum]